MRRPENVAALQRRERLLGACCNTRVRALISGVSETMKYGLSGAGLARFAGHRDGLGEIRIEDIKMQAPVGSSRFAGVAVLALLLSSAAIIGLTAGTCRAGALDHSQQPRLAAVSEPLEAGGEIERPLPPSGPAADRTEDAARVEEPFDRPLDRGPTGSIFSGVPSQDDAAREGEAEKAEAAGSQENAPAKALTGIETAPELTIADRLQAGLEARAALEMKGAQASELRREREAIAAFYTSRDFAPLWFEDGKASEAARGVIARLIHAADDGLDLKNFPVPSLQPAADEALAAADIALSEAVVAYGRQASGSRVDPQTISRLIGLRPELADPAVILATVGHAGEDSGTALRDFNPPQKGYAALRDKLAELRRVRGPVAREPIPAGPVLKVGMRDPRVPLIRARLSLDGQPADEPAETLVYDTRIAAAVADFQKANGLPASGVLTARTIAVLSGGQPSRLENEILANMERWRWMPRDMGESRIEVNIPDFEVSVIEDGEVVSRHRVVVGKEQTPTPIFSNRMQFLIVNPYWNVPPSILRKEMLPKLAADPNYLQRLGYEVFSRDGHLVVRQPPGERNALGRIKFMFPNDYSVYLHDTPSRALFAEDKRAFSHGCVRVDDPFQFAETVLGKGWSEARVKGLIGGKERYVFLPKPLPVHLEYFTTYVDSSGRVQLRDDIYGYSHRVKTALGLEG